MCIKIVVIKEVKIKKRMKLRIETKNISFNKHSICNQGVTPRFPLSLIILIYSKHF
jgi:hypothetical protein